MANNSGGTVTTLGNGVIGAVGVATVADDSSVWHANNMILGGFSDTQLGGTGTQTITASGGTLSVGAFAASNSFSGYSGNLVAGSNSLNLFSSGFTALGSSATVAGGSINSINGVRVSSGTSLSGYGTVTGSIDNQGTITGGSAANGDGSTDGADFLVWQRQSGGHFLSGLAAVSAATVPEPAVCVLAVFAVLVAPTGAWRNRSSRAVKRYLQF